MRLLLIYLACLFVVGCSSGGFVFNDTKELEDNVDMALLSSLEDEGDVAPALDVDSGAKAENSEDLAASETNQSNDDKPTRSFGKRRSKGDDGKPKRSFGKRRSKSDDLVAKPETVQVPEEVIVDINDKVDILFVTDGSFSMREVLRNIPERMDGFIPALDSLNWRAGFISAHVKNNKDKELSSMEIDGAIVLERKYITKGTVSNERIFIDTLTRNKGRKRCAFSPECGGFKETPLLALNEYLISPSRSVETGTHLIREDAHLAVVIVTDNRENKRQGQRVTSDEVINTIQQELGEDKEFSVHVLTTMNDACQGQLRDEYFFAEGNRAPEMLLLARETGGASLSLCSHDYAIPLAEAIQKSVLGEEEVDCSACTNASVISDQDKQV